MSQVLIDMGALKMVLNVLRRAGKAEVADELEKAVGELPAPSTPSAKWYAQGEPDPHGDRYNGERAALMLGHLTDDELANAVFLHYDIRPPLQDIIDGKAFSPIAYVTAAKERIRWLSRALEAEITKNAELKHENHNLNVALGATGYEEADWFTAEERTASAACNELIQARIERMQAQKAKLEEQAKDAARLAGLRELMGYVEDGSSDTVKLFQDDATKSFFVTVGKKAYFSTSFKGAIDEAISEYVK